MSKPEVDNTDEMQNMMHPLDREQVKRPMNAFMLWSKQKRREISKNDPTLHNAQISKLLGEEWKVLSRKDKLPFVEESQKLMVQHKIEHPNYRYRPRQNKLGKLKVYPSYSQPVLVNNKPDYRYESKYPYSYPPTGVEMERDLPPYYSLGARHHSYYTPRYRVCNIPGCYDCYYDRSPYSQHSPSGDRYGYNIPRDQNNSPSMSCLCCPSPSSTSKRSGSLSDYPRNSYDNKKPLPSSNAYSSSSTNFYVESLISSGSRNNEKDSRDSRPATSTEHSTASDSNDESI